MTHSRHILRLALVMWMLCGMAFADCAISESSFTVTASAQTKKKTTKRRTTKRRATRKSARRKATRRTSAEKISALAPNIQRHQGEVEGGYDFWMYDPQEGTNATEKQPVIIFMHGASLCGGGMERARRYGPIHALLRGMDVPCAVIAPHNNGGAWSPKRVNAVLEYAKTLMNIDENRIYVLGMSLGSYGTLDFCATYPEKVAAAMALCGGTSMRNYDGLAKLPLWIIHGTADRAVGIGKSREVVKQLRSLEGGAPMLRYDELPGVNHGDPCRMFYHQVTYDWLLSHTLNKREVSTEQTISTQSLNARYTLPARNKDRCVVQNADETRLESQLADEKVEIVTEEAGEKKN